MPSEFVKLAITIGDPMGIGPEVVLKALAEENFAADLTVVGSRQLLQQTYQHLSRLVAPGSLANPDQLQILDIPCDPYQMLASGQGSAASGAASFAYLEAAIALALAGKVEGIVTGPIAKSAWRLAGQTYPGQTELLAEKSGSDRYGMLFVARSPHTGWTLRTLLATTHIPLRQVPETLTPALMTHKLELLVSCLQQDFGLSHPHIAIAGLNPHSGEQGQLGTEEQDWLISWMAEMADRCPTVSLQGPVPPDTLWVKAGQAWYGTGVREKRSLVSGHPSLVSEVESATEQMTNHKGQMTGSTKNQGSLTTPDAYLALYHDQGLIPVKMLAFDQAVNTSIGLPFIRTSPDHGTAFDIAGQGVADASSLKAALELAIDLSWQRNHRLLTLKNDCAY